MDNQVQLTVISKSKNISLTRLVAATFASEIDFTINELEEIKIAISEAVTNCIIHGYPQKIGEIKIEMIIKNNALVVKVIDYGIGIKDLKRVLQPSYSTKKEHMGLGFSFIDAFMDEFKVETKVNKGTTVIMTKTPERLQKNDKE